MSQEKQEEHFQNLYIYQNKYANEKKCVTLKPCHCFMETFGFKASGNTTCFPRLFTVRLVGRKYLNFKIFSRMAFSCACASHNVQKNSISFEQWKSGVLQFPLLVFTSICQFVNKLTGQSIVPDTDR